MATSRRVGGQAVQGFPPRRTRWDFGAVADGRVYLLRRGEDFDIEVRSLSTAARRWARRNGYRLQTRTEIDDSGPERREVGLYVCFTPTSAPTDD